MEDFMRTAPWLIAALGLAVLTAGCVQESYRSTAYAPSPAYQQTRIDRY